MKVKPLSNRDFIETDRSEGGKTNYECLEARAYKSGELVPFYDF